MDHIHKRRIRTVQPRLRMLRLKQRPRRIQSRNPVQTGQLGARESTHMRSQRKPNQMHPIQVQLFVLLQAAQEHRQLLANQPRVGRRPHVIREIGAQLPVHADDDAILDGHQRGAQLVYPDVRTRRTETVHDDAHGRLFERWEGFERVPTLGTLGGGRMRLGGGAIVAGGGVGLGLEVAPGVADVEKGDLEERIVGAMDGENDGIQFVFCGRKGWTVVVPTGFLSSRT